MADPATTNKSSGKRSKGPRPPRPEGGASARDVTISKALSYVLRHGAEKEGITLDKQGYANLDDLLKWNRLRSLKATVADIERIVKENDKQRYSLIIKPEFEKADASTSITSNSTPDFNEPQDPSHYLIRANQGHSLKIESSELLTLLTPSTIPHEPIIHGAFYGSWEAILQSGGLSKMNRQHMHFAKGLPGENGVLSGFRGDAELLVYVDARRALAESQNANAIEEAVDENGNTKEKASKGGINFWESANHVILTEGDENGFLPLKYFDRVVDRKGDLGVIWQDGVVVMELPPHLKSRKPPPGKDGKGRSRGRGKGSSTSERKEAEKEGQEDRKDG